MAEILGRDEGNTPSEDGSEVDMWLSSGYISKKGRGGAWIRSGVCKREESRNTPRVFTRDT